MTLEKQVYQNHTKLKKEERDIIELQKQNIQLLTIINQLIETVEMLVNKLKENDI